MTIATVKGIYHDGKIEPLEDIPCRGDRKVVIVFLDEIEEKDISWDGAVAKDFFEGYSERDAAYDKL